MGDRLVEVELGGLGRGDLEVVVLLAVLRIGGDLRRVVDRRAAVADADADLALALCLVEHANFRGCRAGADVMRHFRAELPAGYLSGRGPPLHLAAQDSP